MFENMVKSAAMPLVMEMLNAVHAGLAETRDTLLEFKPQDNTIEAAVLKMKLDTYNEIMLLIKNIGDQLEKGYEDAHGTPPDVRMAARHTITNFNRGG